MTLAEPLYYVTCVFDKIFALFLKVANPWFFCVNIRFSYYLIIYTNIRLRYDEIWMVWKWKKKSIIPQSFTNRMISSVCLFNVNHKKIYDSITLKTERAMGEGRKTTTTTAAAKIHSIYYFCFFFVCSTLHICTYINIEW